MKTAPRIIAGAWRGRVLAAPGGETTRPTAGRVRQAVFDMLMHAPWAERAVEGRAVLDVFAGSGALGLEALSRGAGRAGFIERDQAALAAIAANIVACKAGGVASVFGCDALRPPHGTAHELVFLDPPYGKGLVPLAVAALGAAGWIAPGALIVAEFGRGEEGLEGIEVLAVREHGAARVVIWRAGL